MVARRPTVAIVKAFVPKYRAPFHNALRTALDERGIDLLIVQGLPYGDMVAKDDTTVLDWAYVREHAVLRIGGKELTWQRVGDLVADADLVIADQQAARLTNYPIWLRNLVGRQRFAFWGHGINFQPTDASALGETIKRFVSRHVHWWFAYNDIVAALVRDMGFPADRITDVQNAIDTRQLTRQVEAVTPEQLAELRSGLGLTGDHVCVYVGGMYEQKRLPYLLAACDDLRAMVADFEMVFLGGGPAQELVERAAASRDWMHYVGPTFGAEKAAYLALGQLLLMPGLVGLTILDTFAAGVPLVTVADSEHSPEISYLVDRHNGRMLPAGTDPSDYAKAVAELLHDDAAMARLVDGGREARQTYTIEAMVERFASGVEAALAAPLRPAWA